MAPDYKLTYFEFKGVAETIRYLFHYGGIEFEDIRIPHTQWPELKQTTPYGQLPLLEHNGKTVNQSLGICRFLAKLVKLRGKDDWEDLEIDAFVETMVDFKIHCNKYIFCEQSKKEAAKEIILKETIPFYFERYSKRAKNGYLVGGHLTWADLYFAAAVDAIDEFFKIDTLETYPNLKVVKNNVDSLPGIKEWIAKRPADVTFKKIIYKLTCSEITDLGEPIRFLLSYGNIEFVDCRIQTEEWPEYKSQMPFGQVPVLVHYPSGKSLHQSLAICRFLAKQVELSGKTDWENLEIDTIVDTVNDFRLKLYKMFLIPEKEKETARSELLKDVVPFYIERFDKIAGENNGYLATGKLTWADMYFVPVIEFYNYVLKTDMFEKYPNLIAVKENVLSLPAIKTWIEKRPQSEDILNK